MWCCGFEQYMVFVFCGFFVFGYMGWVDEVGCWVICLLIFFKYDEQDFLWVYFVEGFIVYIDFIVNIVICVEDYGDVFVLEGYGNYYFEMQGVVCMLFKFIEIMQFEGLSFMVFGFLVEWEGWLMCVDFNVCEGLVLYDVIFQDCFVLSRVSVFEMVVFYGDMVLGCFWISYFDVGEYLLGKNVNYFEFGCDCFGVICYFDGWVVDDYGYFVCILNVVCMYEEDFGIFWKYIDFLGCVDVCCFC